MPFKRQFVVALFCGILVLALNIQTAHGEDPDLKVLALDFNPKTGIDTRFAPQIVTFTARLTAGPTGLKDEEAGVPTQALINGPAGGTSIVFFRYPVNLTSGNAQDGWYQNTLTLPMHSPVGTWTLAAFVVANNNVPQDIVTYYTSDLAKLGFPTTFEVTNKSLVYLPSIFRPR